MIAPIQYENVPHMAICPVEFDPAFPAAMKRIPRAFYRPERKQWIAPKDRRVWQALKAVFGISAIKMSYAEVVVQAEKVRNIIRPKRPQKLPHVLTEAEVSRLLKVCQNLKHRCILMLIYSAGLRLSELLNLRLADIQPEAKRIFIHAGKGKKIATPFYRRKRLDSFKNTSVFISLWNGYSREIPAANTQPEAFKKYLHLQRRSVK